MATAADIVTSVRMATDQDVSGPVSDAMILAFANEEYPLVRRMVATFASDLFASESGALTVAAGAVEIDVSGISSLDVIFEVKRLNGIRYRNVDVAGPDPEGAFTLVWRRRGMSGTGTAIELYPAAAAPGTYKVRYMATAPALAGSGAVLLPAGAERVLVEATAARVMQRLERDYSFHIRARDLALKELRGQLQPQNYVIQPSRR